MKIILLISSFSILNIILPFTSFSQSFQQVYSYWEHDYYDHNTNEKIPSKCDCDYVEETLLLKSDSTFELTIQKGRMTPEYSKVKGRWQLNSDSLLSLNGKYFEGLILDAGWYESFTIRYHYLSDEKTIQYTELFDGYRLWKGSGEMLSEKKDKKRK